MRIALLNPQGNFDPKDSYLTQHPDFGGQLVYVKEIALALAELGHRVDILTRRIIDDRWPEFAAATDAYPGHEGVQIIRIPCGPPSFLAKEQLWPHLGTDWLNGILNFYEAEGGLPDIFSTHYADGGLAGALLYEKTGIPFTFTAHSLGAQKMDKLGVNASNFDEMDNKFLFRRRILAERISMHQSAAIITSTRQEQVEQYTHHAYAGAVDVHGQDAQRLFVVPPGANREVFSPEPNEIDSSVTDRIKQALQRDVGSGRQDLPLILCSSRLDPKKNVTGLVRAFVENLDLQAKANLAIVVRGLDNPLQQRDKLSGQEQSILNDIATLLDEHQLWHTVTSFPLNSQAELAAAYRFGASTQSVFALTALYEPFGLAPLEAISCGLPAVVTQNGGPTESLYDADSGGEYGVLVDPADLADIARGLLKVLQSDEVWQHYQQAGMQRVISRYTWNSTAKGYLDVFEYALNHKPGPFKLTIPDYFWTPSDENDISPDTLKKLYLKEAKQP